MEPHSAALQTIKNQIAQGEVEQALPPLVTLLESNPAYAELLQAARVNQADLYQLKAQVLKGTIGADEARLVTNQITDNTLQIISRVEAGKLTLFDPQPANAEPTPSKAWRYYVAGGIVTLAGVLIAMRIFAGPKEEACPEFGKDKTLKVLVLPFLKVGEDKDKSKKSPEFDIALNLRRRFTKNIQLARIAEADVKEAYDIEKNYPNPDEALGIARECGADLIVWGRIDVDNNPTDMADVEYRLVDPRKSKISDDPAINQLLAITGQGIWHDNLDIISMQLYLIITNHAAVPIDNGILDSILVHSQTPMVAYAEPDAPYTDESSDPIPMASRVSATNTTYTLLSVGDLATRRNKLDTAINIYNRTLVMNPNNVDALRKRGALLFEKGDFANAAQDFDMALRRDTAHAKELQTKQIEAYRRSGQPDKAAKCLKEFRKKNASPDQSTSAWIAKEEKSIETTRMAALKEADALNQQLARSKRVDVTKQIAAAQANRNVGRFDQAETQARVAVTKAPANPEANNLLIDLLIDKGDTAAAKKIISRAAKSGVRLKARIRPLPEPVAPKPQ